MKDLKNLSEQEKLDLFQVEELESRLEMWGGGDNSGCNQGCANTVCPPVGNGACGGGGGGGGGELPVNLQ